MARQGTRNKLHKEFTEQAAKMIDLIMAMPKGKQRDTFLKQCDAMVNAHLDLFYED